MWLLEGEVVDATWASAEKGVAINQVSRAGEQKGEQVKGLGEQV